ncbi:MAG TPA: hypothetical protein VFN37_09400 [Candidatus Baltobacteraceae bacterium]|nr:hypothetical protein [Candidatus Baltobacteraceae bacterium]
MRLILTLLFAALLGVAAMAAGSYHSMYTRLGGYAGVSRSSSDLVARLSADPRLKSAFADVTSWQRAELAKYAADYACKQAGAGCKPVMPNVALVKEPPPVSSSQKSAALSDLKHTLIAHRIPADIQFAIHRIVR